MEGTRGGRNAKRGRRGTGWRRSRRARSVQVVAGIPDQYFHRFSGGYRQVASSLAPFPTLIPLPYSDDAIFLLPLLPSFYRALFTPVVVVCASPSSLFLFDLPVLRSFLLFAPFSSLVFFSVLSLSLPVLRPLIFYSSYVSIFLYFFRYRNVCRIYVIV